jgi:hypothetical protein
MWLLALNACHPWEPVKEIVDDRRKERRVLRDRWGAPAGAAVCAANEDGRIARTVAIAAVAPISRHANFIFIGPDVMPFYWRIDKYYGDLD